MERQNTSGNDNENEQEQLFPNFSQLPAEIRLMIWKLALWTPNIVQLCFHSLDPTHGFEMYLKHRVIPPLLQACAESRWCALEVYPDKFFEQKETAIMTYMNYEIDTLYIGTANVHMHIDWITEALQLEYVQSLDVDQVKHLAMDVNFWKFWDSEYMLGQVAGFRNLQTLTLSIEDHADSEEPAGFVDLDETLDGDAKGLWDYGSEPGGVVRAGLNILGELPGIYENSEEIRADWQLLPELRFKKLTGKICGERKSWKDVEDEDRRRQSGPKFEVQYGATLRVNY